MERLQKVLAQAGVASRRKSEQLITTGRVKVNGKIVTELGVKVDPTTDRIEVNGRSISQEPLTYYLFYKPTGVITTVKDPQGRTVVMDFFTESKERIYPVGRLDYDTSGLLILTNDGELSHALMHPSFHVDKGYVATVVGIPAEDKLDRLRRGMNLNDGPTAPAEVELLNADQERNEAKVKIVIHEGRNRQVRRMFQAIHHRVKKLHRESYAFLTLDGLKSGQFRNLSKDEVKKLKSLVLTKSDVT